LGKVCHHESILDIVFGELLKVDAKTIDIMREKFVRVCTKIDLIVLVV